MAANDAGPPWNRSVGPNTAPGGFGARASKLLKILEAGHYGVKLGSEDLHRLTVWLDSNAPFFGTCDNTKDQAEGRIVKPTVE